MEGKRIFLWRRQHFQKRFFFSQTSDPHDGHAVLAHVAATIGPDGGTLASDTTGVSITVPPGALTSTQDMFFKVFRDASMSPPVDEAKGKSVIFYIYIISILFFQERHC